MATSRLYPSRTQWPRSPSDGHLAAQGRDELADELRVAGPRCRRDQRACSFGAHPGHKDKVCACARTTRPDSARSSDISVHGTYQKQYIYIYISPHTNTTHTTSKYMTARHGDTRTHKHTHTQTNPVLHVDAHTRHRRLTARSTGSQACVCVCVCVACVCERECSRSSPSVTARSMGSGATQVPPARRQAGPTAGYAVHRFPLSTSVNPPPPLVNPERTMHHFPHARPHARTYSFQKVRQETARATQAPW